jgi:hypothetical protein
MSRPELKTSRVKNRVALAVRCSELEAAQIREAANRERRSVSSYILNAVMSRVAVQHQMLERQNGNLKSPLGSGPDVTQQRLNTSDPGNLKKRI